MQFNLDKRFIKILNDQGHRITWEQLREAYNVRKAEREATPAATTRRRSDALQNSLEIEALREYQKLLSAALTSKT
jgi:hypothetical protein